MQRLWLFLVLALTALVRAEDTNFDGEEQAEDEETETEAEAGDLLNPRQASRQVNCNCQCSSITFLDKFGKINGNCRSADNTGAVWCYVDPRYAQCADLQRSTRTSSLWSYQACATPDIASPQCGGGFNQGGFNQGGFNQGGFNQGGFNQGGGGGFPNNNGGFSNNNGGFPNNNGGFSNNNGGFPNNNNGFNSGIRGSSGGNPLVGSSNPGFSLSSSGIIGKPVSANSGPEGFPFQDNGGFEAVLSLAAKKASAPTTEANKEGDSDAVSFSR